MTIEPLAQCSMCEEWTQGTLGRFGEGRCKYLEEDAREGFYSQDLPVPIRIEVWLSESADASTCPGLGLTAKGRKELDTIRAEAGHKDRSGQPASIPEWVSTATRGV